MGESSVGTGPAPGPAPAPRGAPAAATHLGDEQLQEVGLVPQRVVHQAVTEGHHAVGEVVLGQPRHHPLLLHVGPARHVDDEVAQVLPMPGGEGHAWVSHGHPVPLPGPPGLLAQPGHAWAAEDCVSDHAPTITVAKSATTTALVWCPRPPHGPAGALCRRCDRPGEDPTSQGRGWKPHQQAE